MNKSTLKKQALSNNIIALKRTKRESPIEKAEKWIVAEKDQPGLDTLFINDSIGKFFF